MAKQVAESNLKIEELTPERLDESRPDVTTTLDFPIREQARRTVAEALRRSLAERSSA